MQSKTLSLLTLTAILSGCATENCKPNPRDYSWSNMPIAGVKVAEELDQNCTGEKCPNLNNWLNELYLFKQQYETQIVGL
jgi:hypothetical protein